MLQMTKDAGYPDYDLYDDDLTEDIADFIVDSVVISRVRPIAVLDFSSDSSAAITFPIDEASLLPIKKKHRRHKRKSKRSFSDFSIGFDSDSFDPL